MIRTKKNNFIRWDADLITTNLLFFHKQARLFSTATIYKLQKKGQIERKIGGMPEFPSTKPPKNFVFQRDLLGKTLRTEGFLEGGSTIFGGKPDQDFRVLLPTDPGTL